MAVTVGWPPLWADLLATIAQLEVKLMSEVGRRAGVREGCVIVHDSASFRAGRQGGRTG